MIAKAEDGMIEFCSRNVRELKGAPLAIVVLLTMTPIPVTKDWLARSSGYTDKPVSQACSYLKENGWIDCSSAGWFLAEGFQLPLPGRNYSELEDAEGKIIDAEKTQDDSEAEQVEDDSDESCPAIEIRPVVGGRNYSDRGSIIIIKESKDLKELKELNNNNNNNGRKNSDSDRPELWDILKEVGVRKNDRTRALLRLEHVTPQYLRAKVVEFKADGLDGPKWAGLFIRAVEECEPAPPTQANGHFAGCDCVTCQIDRAFGRIK
jgi:hypothetical protein